MAEDKKKPLGEKIEDGLDNLMGGIQDTIYGVPEDPNKDIPRTIEKPSGIREINKVQTRRNINRLIFKKPVVKILLIILGLGLLGWLLTELIMRFLLM